MLLWQVKLLPREMEWLSDVSGRRRAQKQALCYYFICQTHHAAYNKVHNRGCSLSTFFSFYMRHQQRQRRRKAPAPPARKRSQWRVYLYRELVGQRHSAGNKQKRMLNYLQETKVPALRWPFFLFSLFPWAPILLLFSTRMARCWIPMVWWWLTHAHVGWLWREVLCSAKGVALLFPVCLSQDTWPPRN